MQAIAKSREIKKKLFGRMKISDAIGKKRKSKHNKRFKLAQVAKLQDVIWVGEKKINASEYFGESLIAKLRNAKTQAEKEEITMIHNSILNNNFQKRLKAGECYE